MYAEPCTKQQELYDSGELLGAGGKPYGEIGAAASAEPRVLNNQTTRTYVNNQAFDDEDLDI
jgi:hypothetical protein